jgi:predicted transglutaminase-like cysteine proteinase
MRKAVGISAAGIVSILLLFTLAEAAYYSYPRAVGHISFGDPALAPFAHARFCLQYPEDCRVSGIPFRGQNVELTEELWSQLLTVNQSVNRAIRPQRNHEGVWGERWLIAPKAGDCNDYAVTKRHELLKKGWPTHALLLAEVVIPGGEHHLVLVGRTREGDFVLDNLAQQILPWSETRYRWVRIQSPRNPMFWSEVRSLGV